MWLRKLKDILLEALVVSQACLQEATLKYRNLDSRPSGFWVQTQPCASRHIIAPLFCSGLLCSSSVNRVKHDFYHKVIAVIDGFKTWLRQ